MYTTLVHARNWMHVKDYTAHRQVAAGIQTRPTDLACEFAYRLLACYHPRALSSFIIITPLESLYSFCGYQIG